MEPIEILPPLLRVPPEIRLLVYAYLLPTCKPSHNRRGLKTVWQLGSTSLMSTCRFLHSETNSLLYGTNIFEVDVGYGGSIFQFRRQLASGLVPRETPGFLGFFGEAGRRGMRRILVNIDHVDSYTGMIKYNCGGAGLATGLKKEVAKVVEVLREAAELQYLHINLRDWNRNIEGVYATPDFLMPFLELSNVRGEVKVTGDIEPEFAKWLIESVE